MSQTNSPDIPGFDEPQMVAERPGWPKVVGIVSLVWGIFWVGCVGCGFAGIPLQEWGMSQNPETKSLLPIPDVFRPTTGQYVAMGLGGLLDLLLVFAGIALLRRSASARTMHLAYGVLAAVLSVAGLVFALQASAAQTQWLKDNPSSEWAKYVRPSANLLVGVVITIFSLAWPIFCLVWFGMVKRTHESMLAEAPPA
ncbi:MAG: hypothetical protein AB7K52_03300 [Phycisphaerales bacterium]